MQPSADVAEGDVARQDPEQNTKLEKGKTISIWISSGEGKVEVPNVVGMTEVQAAEKLGAAGLKVVSKPEVNPEQEVGTVLRQNPEGGKKVDAGTTVTITVAAATNTVKVPAPHRDDAGQRGRPAEQHEPGGQGGGDRFPTARRHRGRPGSQSGAEVQPGATVKVYVSNAPVATTVKVPAVAALGLTEAQAKAKLAQYGLKAKVIDLETPDFKPGLCIYQDPAAGVEVKIGSVVEITIAREPVTTTTTTAPPTTTTTAPPTTATTTTTIAP